METGLCESHYTPSSLHSFFFPFTSQLHNCIFLFYVDASLCAKRQRQWLVSFYSDWMPSVPLEILQSWPTACIILPYIISKNTRKQYILISKTLLDFEFRYWKMQGVLVLTDTYSTCLHLLYLNLSPNGLGFFSDSDKCAQPICPFLNVVKHVMHFARFLWHIQVFPTLYSKTICYIIFSIIS